MGVSLYIKGAVPVSMYTLCGVVSFQACNVAGQMVVLYSRIRGSVIITHEVMENCGTLWQQ